MSIQQLPPTTAGINPETFSDDLVFAANRTAAVVILALFIILGFALRVNHLGAESLSEDELNKLQTVEEYETNGLTARNGEHPFLMKGLQTVSVVGFRSVNSWDISVIPQVSDEVALRFPIALFGTFTTLILFLLVSELFGRSIGLLSAIFWAVEPVAIGFDRIAKEDSLVLFFFLLTCLFWLRAQSRAERGEKGWLRYTWLSAIAFGALMASKYYLFLLAIPAGYYNIFLPVGGTKWNLGRPRWLLFCIVIGIAFLILNPTILIPETWRQMLNFSSGSLIAHDSLEYMGRPYNHQITNWLKGVPWTFYYVFIAVKTSLSILLLFVIGLPVMFRRGLGDGRFFLLIWAFIWFVPFSVVGGKFTRYFTTAEPLILIVAAVGFYFVLKAVEKILTAARPVTATLQIALFLVVIAVPVYDSLSLAPHYRLFTNAIGGGTAAAGFYFPHDEFYDASTRDIIECIAEHAQTGSIIADEAPPLFEYYARKLGRGDMISILMSDPSQAKTLRAGDFVVDQRGRRYFSNGPYMDYLEKNVTPIADIDIFGVRSATVYQLDDASAAQIHQIAQQQASHN